MINKLPGGMDPGELKRLLCESVSGGRTSSLRALTGGELAKLREELRARTGFNPRRSDGEKKRKRSQVLRQLELYGIDTKDWSAVNAFVALDKIAGKEFAQLSISELESLRRKMYAINRKAKKKALEEVRTEVRVVTPSKKRRVKRMNYVSNMTLEEVIKSSKFN